ncbi:hypothetical protein [Flavobacterium gawalongense]|uniref:Porin n=1 Tax=Flavobacterium gawalongense TaxID=2594432 RepID=A0A553BDY3_9FLAO|nr:hypothetical protein [Flavobacterium gawalongense]TRW98918.1 hypothetical protein FNW33_15550 [Flavobacterium gawalongense]TRX03497.1 hypothetical protein FNW12_15280 [Flavobacterium gawalongense]TRX06460.1 hypothetical protein FNW11_14370 [Flavobacterium gawalongense]TRX07285.1 hypothetical protein FNW10_14600 [Flavobacterium gawalongense]TRX25011.1 hypothetical protein FNW38_12225 [Flavobacterium gawalongense]
MKFCNYILTGILYFICLTVVAQTEETKTPWIELNGYIKDIQSTYFIQKIDSNASVNLIHNRLNFKFNISPKISGRLEIRNRIFYGEQIKQIPDFGKTINQYNGLLNLSHLWIDEKSFVAHSVIDRMLIQYGDEKWDIKIGRQRINWGINNIWNPNDIFNAYNFLDFDYEERPGNDAIRIQRNLNTNSVLELAYKPGKNKEEHTAAFLYKFNKWKYDFQFLGGVYQTDYVFGGGWAGNIKEAGFKGEMSYFIPKKNTLDTSETFSFSIMADQTFKNDWYISLASLYNSNPTNVFAGNGSFYNSNLSAKLLFPFRYNFYATVMKTISPIASFNFSFIYSPEKNTLIVVPSYAWNVATNFDLDFTAQSFFAEQTNSYKNLITQIYIRGRWSF